MEGEERPSEINRQETPPGGLTAESLDSIVRAARFQQELLAAEKLSLWNLEQQESRAWKEHPATPHRPIPHIENVRDRVRRTEADITVLKARYVEQYRTQKGRAPSPEELEATNYPSESFMLGKIEEITRRSLTESEIQAGGPEVIRQRYNKALREIEIE